MKLTNHEQGFAPVIILITTILVLAIGGIFVISQGKLNLANRLSSSSSTSYPTQSPLDQGSSNFMKDLGCTDEASCKTFCSKPENKDKCKALFTQYGGGQNQSNGIQGDMLKYSHVPNDCKSNPNPIFSHDITTMSSIVSIFPPAHVIGGELKTRAYIHVNGKVPLYAIADSVLVEGSFHKTVDGLSQYGLQFQVSCEVRFLYDHVSEPVDQIKAVFPSNASDNSRTIPISPPIYFKAGDLVGYTSGTSYGAWDFAVFNTTKANYFSTQPDYNNNWVYDFAECPFNYFSSDKKASYFALFKNDSGVESTPVELCK